MMPVETFKKRCKGVVPVQLCPFTDDGELNIDGLKQNTEFLVDFAKGGKDLVVMTNGSTLSSRLLLMWLTAKSQL
jgi:dihydrodipicolinate synthase/N-acetylneuraminate lyase